MKYLYSLIFTLCTVSAMQAAQANPAIDTSYVIVTTASGGQLLSIQFKRDITNQENTERLLAFINSSEFNPLNSRIHGDWTDSIDPLTLAEKYKNELVLQTLKTRREKALEIKHTKTPDDRKKDAEAKKEKEGYLKELRKEVDVRASMQKIEAGYAHLREKASELQAFMAAKEANRTPAEIQRDEERRKAEKEQLKKIQASFAFRK